MNLTEAGQSRKETEANLAARRWHRLCERYLPAKTEDSIWRGSREAGTGEPSQGWKLHISATILEACDLFEKVAPFLTAADVQFKAPKSLDELSKINCGLQYGYPQVGKFMTVYCTSAEQAVGLARQLDELTREFISISVPFDEQYAPESSVFYRYGAFGATEIVDQKGVARPAIQNAAGEMVFDDRMQAVPEWMTDPFRSAGRDEARQLTDRAETPFATTYKVFRAITQRGKGGTYQALDLSVSPPRLCIIKEGRKDGEAGWDGQDGYRLVKNEFEVLETLGGSYPDVPRVFSSFEASGNFYCVMQFIEGQSVHQMIRRRRRRLSFRQVLDLAAQIAQIIEEIHRAGWVWNDCKPANLILTPSKSLRPIDFEGAYRIDQTAPFDWQTKGFSKSLSQAAAAGAGGKNDDLYALGAVIYFLLTGRLYDPDAPAGIAGLRRQVPQGLVKITENLLSGTGREISKVRRDFEKLKMSMIL